MRFKEIYDSTNWVSDARYEFIALEINDNTYIGKSNEGNVSILIKSLDNSDPIWQRTKLLTLQTNTEVVFKSNDLTEEGVFHILKCLSNSNDEVGIFLDLCESLFIKSFTRSADLVNIFNVMVDFFEHDTTYSATELQGLYGELLFIEIFKHEFNFLDYWQSRDKLKFDFSLTNDLKIEIKTTTKSERIHKFIHEQISSKSISTYVVSFKLLYDDKGLSLDQLIDSILLLPNLKLVQKNKLLKIKYKCERTLLEKQKYQSDYSISNLKVFDSKTIPHFDDVDGVSGATYDSTLENIPEISKTEFLKIITSFDKS
jgi:hypothetical protein